MLKKINHYRNIPQLPQVIQKQLLITYGSIITPIYTINEYPKSGGTWLKFMLADTLNLPPWIKNKPVWGSCIAQGHWLHLKGKPIKVVLFRDGRDVMVSLYYHTFFKNEFRTNKLLEITRSEYNFSDFNNIKENLLPFMKKIYDSPQAPNFTWKQFINTWIDQPGVTYCRYEDLRSNTPQELQRLFNEITDNEFLSEKRAKEISDKYSLKNMKKNFHDLHLLKKDNQGVQTNFIRKGQAGGWGDSFTDEALDWFEHNNKKELLKLGYSLGRTS